MRSIHSTNNLTNTKYTAAQKRWDETAIYWKEELEGRLKVHTELHLETLGTIQVSILVAGILSLTMLSI